MRFRHIVFCVCLAFGSGAALAQDLKITAVPAPVLMIFADTDANTQIGELSAGDYTLPLAVDAVSPNLMLKVNVNGTEGWVFGHHVKTNKKPKLSAGCNQQVAQEDVGATRGLGAGCN